MKKEKVVAIIDSGISENSFYDYNNQIIGGISYYIDENKLIEDSNFDDMNGHGTNCASIIHKYCPKAKLYIIKILNKDNQSHSLLLIEALKHLLNVDVDIINLSLSIKNDNRAYNEEISALLKKIFKQGKVITASVTNREESSYPAENPYVIGVNSGIFTNGEYFNYKADNIIQCIGDITPEFVQTINNKYEWFGGNSKATACVSAAICNILINEGCKKNSMLYEILDKYSDNDHLTTLDKINKKNNRYKSEKIFNEKRLGDIFSKYIKNYDLNMFNMLFSDIDFNYEKTFDLILDLEKYIDKRVEMKNIRYENFLSPASIVDFIEKKGK